MIKNFLLAALIFAVSGFSLRQKQDKDISPLVDEMRVCFFLSVDDEEELNRLEYLIEHNFGKDENKYPPKILAYAGGMDALKAKHTYNPFSMWTHIKSGVEKLDKAVAIYPDNLEIRFLRFAVLDNVPGIFGVSENRQKDLNAVVSLLQKKDYTELNSDVQRTLAEYLFESKRLNEKQKEILRKVFPEI